MPALPRPLLLTLVLLGLTTGLFSCDGCEPSTAPSGYELWLSPQRLYLTGGGSGSSAVEIVRHGRFKGLVTIRASGSGVPSTTTTQYLLISTP